MEKLPNYADDRNQGWCVHCGGLWQTDDHVPSKVFLDLPYPEVMPSLPSCRVCNNSFSVDEEYVACLIECVIAGTVDVRSIRREKIRKALARNRKLSARIDASRQETSEGILWAADMDIVHRIILKCARGHVAYEHNEPKTQEPTAIALIPLASMSEQERNNFEEPPASLFFPEIGSRAMQRLLIVDGICVTDWVEVQPGRYRYLVNYNQGLAVRIVISEYLAAEVVWED